MYINKDKYNTNNFIYRFSSIERTLELIGNGEMTFVRSKLWNDPYENFLSRQKIKTNKGNIDLSYLSKEVYGQCWTTKKESDFAWRVYNSNNFGARIKVKIKEYHDLLISSIKKSKEDDFIFGKIQYYPWTKIKTQYENIDNFKISSIFSILSRSDMFFKRNEFKHEAEYRVLYKSSSLGKTDNTVIKFKIDPNLIIKSIMLDPRMVENQFESYCKLFKKLGYTGKIYHSKLYGAPNLDIKIDMNINVTKK